MDYFIEGLAGGNDFNRSNRWLLFFGFHSPDIQFLLWINAYVRGAARGGVEAQLTWEQELVAEIELKEETNFLLDDTPSV